jgi:hypothetical protein
MVVTPPRDTTEHDLGVVVRERLPRARALLVLREDEPPEGLLSLIGGLQEEAVDGAAHTRASL